MVKPSILVVDDEKDICLALNILLTKEGYAVKEAYNGEQALERIRKENFDIIMTDIKMEKMDGFEVLNQAQKICPETSVVMMTAFASVGSAVEAMRSGAADYITKPFINDEIRMTIKRILQSRALQMENQILRQELSQRREGFANIIGNSEPMQKVFTFMEKVIPNKSNILITGESGTGKGLVAQAIHESGPRKDKPFISINCGAIPENLLESELFGHKKGAFTSANEDKKGLITMASGGTLFLDEIGELPPALQVKLLHVIQTKELTPVGDTRVITVDVRIIAATNADLMQRVKEGRFREDLYYRLNVIEIRMPALRERRDDIPVLIKHYLAIAAKEAGKNVKDIDYEAMQALLSYDWPGNIRELRNTIERATVLADGGIITIHDLQDKFRTLDIEGVSTSSLRHALDEFEREYIRRSMVESKGNKEAAAGNLGIDLATLYRKLKKLRIETA
ncbi:MAG TPA: sigma-54 dependent transcriptional regulator [Nitrospirota bacterium]|nr:sigma-54 dependent transcriptional regulator [Nitrospirota bacterium]